MPVIGFLRNTHRTMRPLSWLPSAKAYPKAATLKVAT
jgi:hypothetical protein